MRGARSSAALAAIAVAAGLCAAPAAASRCATESPPHTVALVELYTSEGCNSCPPADRWLRAMRGDSVVPLSLHVDYWDRLGWKDRFAQPRFTDRQRTLSAHSGSRVIYTPGVFLDLQEFRGWRSEPRLQQALRTINARPAGADIRLALDTAPPGQLAVEASFVLRPGVAAGEPQAFLVLYENRLASEVQAGENRGARLEHDYVVREWLGPIEVPGRAELKRRFALARDWKARDLGVAAFVQDSRARQVLQASALPFCSAPGS